MPVLNPVTRIGADRNDSNQKKKIAVRNENRKKLSKVLIFISPRSAVVKTRTTSVQRRLFIAFSLIDNYNTIMARNLRNVYLDIFVFQPS